VLCNIELSNVTNEDGGKWSCSMESYVLGDHASGYKDAKTFNLKVVEPEEEGLAGRSGFTTPSATSTASPRSEDSFIFPGQTLVPATDATATTTTTTSKPVVFPDTTTPSNDDFKPSSDEDNQFSNITISDDECLVANCTTTAKIQDHKAFIPGLLGGGILLIIVLVLLVAFLIHRRQSSVSERYSFVGPWRGDKGGAKSISNGVATHSVGPIIKTLTRDGRGSDGTDEEKVAFNKKTSGVELSALDQLDVENSVPVRSIYSPTDLEASEQNPPNSRITPVSAQFSN